MKTTILKKDSEVVRSLEDHFFQTLREAKKEIKNGNGTESIDKLMYAHEIKKIRGYETISDKKFTEIFDQYLEKFSRINP